MIAQALVDMILDRALKRNKMRRDYKTGIALEIRILEWNKSLVREQRALAKRSEPVIHAESVS